MYLPAWWKSEAQKMDICGSAARSTYTAISDSDSAGRPDTNDEAELTIAATAADIQTAQKVYEGGTSAIRM